MTIALFYLTWTGEPAPDDLIVLGRSVLSQDDLPAALSEISTHASFHSWVDLQQGLSPQAAFHHRSRLQEAHTHRQLSPTPTERLRLELKDLLNSRATELLKEIRLLYQEQALLQTKQATLLAELQNLHLISDLRQQLKEPKP